VTLRCEHSCPYCQVSRQSADRARFDMSEETAMRAVDVALSAPSPSIKVEFQGGEPLLNFELVQKIVTAVQDRAPARGKNVEFVIATNLALLTDEVLSFCRDNGVLLSTSFDGPADLHNRNRPRPGGSGTFCRLLCRSCSNFLARQALNANRSLDYPAIGKIPIKSCTGRLKTMPRFLAAALACVALMLFTGGAGAPAGRAAENPPSPEQSASILYPGFGGASPSPPSSPAEVKQQLSRFDDEFNRSRRSFPSTAATDPLRKLFSDSFDRIRETLS
jgi:Radical SAM superfamily/4Fe-4S single cluster domain